MNENRKTVDLEDGGVNYRFGDSEWAKALSEKQKVIIESQQL